MQSLDLELRQRLAKYLAGDIDLEQLHRWLSSEVWDIESRAEPQTADTFREVDLLLAEYAHGDWTEAELKHRVAPLLTSYTVMTGEGGTRWPMSSGAVRTFTAQVELVAR